MIDFKQIIDNEGSDLDLTLGDILWIEPTQQHVYDILSSMQGSFRQFPNVGVDAENYIHDDDPVFFLRKIRKELTADGMNITGLDYDEYKLQISGSYA